MTMLTLNHFFVNGWLPAICVFSQMQFLMQVDRLLVFLKYAKVVFTVSQGKCSMRLGTGLKKWEAVSEYHIFHQLNGRKESLIMHWILSYEWWETSCKQDNLVIYLHHFFNIIDMCSAWVYWELWCQAPSQTVMQVSHMLFFFLEQ